MKFDIVVVDPPYSFGDKLTQSSVKRGSEANYSTMSISDIKNLPVQDICNSDAVLCLWVPSSLLQEGLDIMKSWGFRQTQTHVWVKIKKNPFSEFKKIKKIMFAPRSVAAWMEMLRKPPSSMLDPIITFLKDFDLNNILSFGMGRLFRQTHEICLIGVKGKVYNKLVNKSQRSVHFDVNMKHSAKPEKLQDMLDLMFPTLNKVEMFARRHRTNWICVGNEAPGEFFGEDIRNSIERLKNIKEVVVSEDAIIKPECYIHYY